MSVEIDLYAHLSIYAGLTALIDSRIYPLKAPQEVTVPYCVYQIISEQRFYSHGGFSNLSRLRMQISAYGNTELQVSQVAEQVIMSMEAWPSANANVQASQQENTFNAYEDITGLFYMPIDFFVFYG